MSTAKTEKQEGNTDTSERVTSISGQGYRN